MQARARAQGKRKRHKVMQKHAHETREKLASGTVISSRKTKSHENLVRGTPVDFSSVSRAFSTSGVRFFRHVFGAEIIEKCARDARKIRARAARPGKICAANAGRSLESLARVLLRRARILNQNFAAFDAAVFRTFQKFGAKTRTTRARNSRAGL